MALAVSNNPAPLRLGQVLGGGGEGSGGMKMALVTFVGDTSYPTGGSINVTPILEAAGLDIVSRIYAVIPITQLGYEWDYIAAVDKLKVYQQPAAAAAGPSPEVPNTTNLSALTPACLVIYE